MSIDVNEDFLELKDYTQKNYLVYSVTVLQDRAIPYLSDGQKPVHRRILFGMRELNNYSNQPYKKSARIVGDVMGKFHPHGDSSIYQAMVRMAQPFSLRYPLVDGQGNFGTLDGDSAAAMRYTESRLTPLAEQILLSELNMNTVRLVPNYDGTLSEPSILPSRLNILLLNGASGIAVGMATDIPSHNMREITNATLAAIDNPHITLDEILEHVKGPDFPNGGRIIDSPETIKKIYETGRGSIRVRAKWKLEKLDRGQWQIAVYELPAGSSTRSVLKNIDKTTNPQVQKDKNGKPKPLSQKVVEEKNFLLSILDDAFDDSDEITPIRLVLKPKSSRQDPEEFMNALTSRIGLEESTTVNLTTVGLDNRPNLRNLKDLITDWIKFRFATITERVKWRLDKVLKRIHILEGRIIALLNINEVIDIIKSSDKPKDDLMLKIGVTDIQAEDILEIKLRQLARLESMNIEKELKELNKEKVTLEGLLSDDKKMYKLMKKEIEEDTQKFEDVRRTEINEDKVTVSRSIDTIIDEPITVILTEQGWLTSRKGHDIDTENVQLKTDDKIRKVLQGRSATELAFIGSDGRVYSTKTSDIPNGKSGFVHYNTLFNISSGTKVVATMFATSDKALFFTNDGYGFISSLVNLTSKNKAGKTFLTLPEANSQIFEPIVITDDKKLVAVLTDEEKLLCYPLAEINELDKGGKGVQLIKLTNNKIKQINIYPENTLTYKEKNKEKTITGEILAPFIARRGAKGKKVEKVTLL